MEQAENFSLTIGSSARIFEGISKAEPDAGFAYRQLENWCGYRDESYGRGYINAIANTFPELSRLRTHMEAAMTEKYQDAVVQYGAAQARLADLCDCRSCSDVNSQPSAFCLPRLAEFIIRVTY